MQQQHNQGMGCSEMKVKYSIKQLTWILLISKVKVMLFSCEIVLALQMQRPQSKILADLLMNLQFKTQGKYCCLRKASPFEHQSVLAKCIA